MEDSEAVLRARFSWVRHYEKSKDAGVTCRRCGISRPTLRKWWRRYQALGEAGLVSLSRRRHRLPEPKVKDADTEAVLALRDKRRLGPKSIQSELQRLHQTSFSTATIWRILARHGVSASVRSQVCELVPDESPKFPSDTIAPIHTSVNAYPAIEFRLTTARLVRNCTNLPPLTIARGFAFCVCTMRGMEPTPPPLLSKYKPPFLFRFSASKPTAFTRL